MSDLIANLPQRSENDEPTPDERNLVKILAGPSQNAAAQQEQYKIILIGAAVLFVLSLPKVQEFILAQTKVKKESYFFPLLLALMFCVTVYIILRFLRRKTE
jgi:hypothetical protein